MFYNRTSYYIIVMAIRTHSKIICKQIPIKHKNQNTMFIVIYKITRKVSKMLS